MNRPDIKKPLLVAILGLFLQVTDSLSAEPRIGLVLSGGGARGAAHIGVLKVLEELRIPIHAIAGTSMGALVGGAYASGVTTSQLEQSITSLDWDKLLADDPPRGSWPARRKQASERPTWNFTLEERDGEFGVGMGAVEGQNVELFLTNLVQSSEGIEQFDDFPIPFRAIATNLENGQMAVFDHGSLSRAMRASMSVPGFFSPVETKESLFVDGGLVRNLPVDVVRKMGVNTVIAVNLGTTYLSRDQLRSLFGVAGQMLVILTEQNVQISLAELNPEKDLLIVPELNDISAADFKRSAEAIAAGGEATRKMAQQLKRYSIGRKEYQKWHSKRFDQPATPKQQVDRVRVAGTDKVNPDLFKPLQRKYQGKPLKRSSLEKDIGEIYGRGYFERLSYHIKQEGDQNILVVDALEKPWGAGYMSFGFGLMSDHQGDNRFSLRGVYTKPWINSLGAEWITELSTGNEPRLFTEFYQPIRLDRAGFIAPYLDLSSTPLSVFDGDKRLARYDISRVRGGLDIGTTLKRSWEIRLGAYLGQTRFDLDTGTLLLPEATRKDSGLRASISFDTLDSPNVPTSGQSFRLYARNPLTQFGADDSYTLLNGEWQGAWSFDVNTLVTTLRGGSSLGDNMLYYDQFPLGGFHKLSGYANEQFRGNKMAFGSLVYTRRIAVLPSPIGRGLYLGGSLEVGRLWDIPTTSSGEEFLNPEKTRFGSSLFFSADSFLGPFHVGLGFSGEGDNTLYFLLGQPSGL
ncbi:MAG: BamA/TamA family outer membrane protein [Gammaproteobacteria bacterium]|nr:BamA/TamA family outer membrane protein [Gammaproteobacteria bacterium]